MPPYTFVLLDVYQYIQLKESSVLGIDLPEDIVSCLTLVRVGPGMLPLSMLVTKFTSEKFRKKYCPITD